MDILGRPDVAPATTLNVRKRIQLRTKCGSCNTFGTSTIYSWPIAGEKARDWPISEEKARDWPIAEENNSSLTNIRGCQYQGFG